MSYSTKTPPFKSASAGSREFHHTEIDLSATSPASVTASASARGVLASSAADQSDVPYELTARTRTL